jgi:hypothetical protein
MNKKTMMAAAVAARVPANVTSNTPTKLPSTPTKPSNTTTKPIVDSRQLLAASAAEKARVDAVQAAEKAAERSRADDAEAHAEAENAARVAVEERVDDEKARADAEKARADDEVRAEDEKARADDEKAADAHADDASASADAEKAARAATTEHDGASLWVEWPDVAGDLGVDLRDADLLMYLSDAYDSFFLTVQQPMLRACKAIYDAACDESEFTHPDVVATAEKGPSVGERAHVLSEKARVHPFVQCVCNAVLDLMPPAVQLWSKPNGLYHADATRRPDFLLHNHAAVSALTRCIQSFGLLAVEAKRDLTDIRCFNEAILHLQSDAARTMSLLVKQAPYCYRRVDGREPVAPDAHARAVCWRGVQGQQWRRAHILCTSRTTWSSLCSCWPAPSRWRLRGVARIRSCESSTGLCRTQVRDDIGQEPLCA